MATVKMLKGNKYADIFDSPETIAQAEKDGYVLAEKPVKATKTEAPKAEASEEKPVARGRSSRQ